MRRTGEACLNPWWFLDRLAGSAILAFAVFVTFAPAVAGEADVIAVEVTLQSDGGYRFDVTVEHTDEGWDHYVDFWEIRDETTGSVIATRKLLHPHVDEQPFTRSLTGVSVPDGTEHVLVRAHDSVHKFGGREMRVAVSGETRD